MKKIIVFLFSVIVVGSLLNSNLAAAQGDGTEQNPYVLTNEANLKELRDSVNNGESYEDKFFILRNNIRLMETNWHSIGSSGDKSFKGTLDGYGFTIFDLKINSLNNNWAGLFGSLSGTVKNVNVEGEVKIGNATEYDIVSDSVRIGGVAAVVEQNGSITNCATDISVESYVRNAEIGYVHIGSVVGANYGLVKNCNGSGEVKSFFEVTYPNTEKKWNLCAHNVIGGVVGQNNNKVDACNSTTTKVFGDIKSLNTGASVYLGGIVGQMDSGNINNCYGATIDLAGETKYHANSQEHAIRVGGIVGSMYGGTITNCSTAYDKIKGAGGGSVSSDSKVNVNKYVLMYLSNGGNGSMENSNISLLSTEEYTILENTYNLNGAKFLRWNSEQNGSGKNYNPGDKIFFQSDLILYAIWENLELPKYNITLQTNGGTIVTLEASSKIDKEPISTKSGYILEGWYTTSDFKSETKVSFPFTLEKDTTLYANFVINDTEQTLIVWIILFVISGFIILFIALYILWRKKDKKPLKFLVPIFRKINQLLYKTKLNCVELELEEEYKKVK